MQAIKEKLNDMSAMRKAKAEAKAEEKAEKDLAKARVEIAKEVRLAREAEAAMDLHVNKAAEVVAKQEAKHPELRSENQLYPKESQNPYGHDTSGLANDPYGSHASNILGSPTTTTASTLGSTTGGPPTNNIV